jgi:hypothetical protein
MLPPATVPFSAPLVPSLLCPCASLSALALRLSTSLLPLSIRCTFNSHLLRPVRPSTGHDLNVTHASFAPRFALLSSPPLHSRQTTQLLRYPKTVSS